MLIGSTIRGFCLRDGGPSHGVLLLEVPHAVGVGGSHGECYYNATSVADCSRWETSGLTERGSHEGERDGNDRRLHCERSMYCSGSERTGRTTCMTTGGTFLLLYMQNSKNPVLK